MRILQEWQGETANFQRKFEEGEGTAGFAQGEQNEEQNNATGMMQPPASNLLLSLRLILRSNRRAPHRFNKDGHKTAAGMQAIPSKIAEPKTHFQQEATFSSLAKNRSQTFLNMATKYNKKYLQTWKWARQATTVQVFLKQSETAAVSLSTNCLKSMEQETAQDLFSPQVAPSIWQHP